MKRRKIKATYRNGVIEPLDRIDLPEGQELEVEFSVLQKTPRELTPEEATQTYTALIQQSEGWWIGWILEVRGVIGQERTRSELLDTLQITLREILEYETPEVSLRTESEIEEVKASDILEFGVKGASNQIESGFEEVSIAI
ncbi:MAG: antitoxin family protein [Candidatus Poribacteria bacterium]|nr:antitoxin family protein [Candidatus Poribacteria bacterium]